MRKIIHRHLKAVHRRFSFRKPVKVIGFISATLGICVVLGSSVLLFEAARRPLAGKLPPFPVTVDIRTQSIEEHADPDGLLEAEDPSPILAILKKAGPLGETIVKIARIGATENVAAISARTLVIMPGERREEVAAHFGKILGWDASERKTFLDLVATSSPILTEGKFAPGRYVTLKDAGPEALAEMVVTRFNDDVASRYTDEVAEKVPLEDALTIASLLEREAYDFEDMRLISGIIWNRLFAGMELQLDATLQYAKGSSVAERSWWPGVIPADKYIPSPYNTYDNAGLPPTPIANPSVEAIIAALNPRKTDCLFYFHDKDAGFHCAPTYEGHVALLQEYYGSGR